MDTEFPTEVDDITGDRQPNRVLTGNVTPEVHPSQLRRRAIRRLSVNQQHWLETRDPSTRDWVHHRPMFQNMRPTTFTGNASDIAWSPSMPPMECKSFCLSHCSAKLTQHQFCASIQRPPMMTMKPPRFQPEVCVVILFVYS